MLAEEEALDRAACAYIVARYLAGQGWQLADPAALAERIWPQLKGQALAGTAAVEAVETAAWQEYAVLLHGYLRGVAAAENELAWTELGAWLRQQVHRLTDHPQEQEEVVQEALFDLQSRLVGERLAAPRALWAYALTALRRKQIDRHRRQQALKRGGDNVLSLEGMEDEDDGRAWQEVLPGAGMQERETEGTVAKRETRQQLRDFFQAHLSSPLQRAVVEAHFLDGLSPADIAGLVGKKPHEIRMAKARAVARLRALPEGAMQELSEILNRWEEEDR